MGDGPVVQKHYSYKKGTGDENDNSTAIMSETEREDSARVSGSSSVTGSETGTENDCHIDSASDSNGTRTSTSKKDGESDGDGNRSSANDTDSERGSVSSIESENDTETDSDPRNRFSSLRSQGAPKCQGQKDDRCRREPSSLGGEIRLERKRGLGRPDMAGHGPNVENRRDRMDQCEQQTAVEGGRRPQRCRRL
jgi:hypothetical protein